MSLSELLALETDDYRQVLLTYGTISCKSNLIQNPMMKDHRLILKHQHSKECLDQACTGYHMDEDRRRPLISNESSTYLNYRSLPCPSFTENFICFNVDTCTYSHSQSETYYHPSFYKTSPCQQEQCYFENKPIFCPFLHPFEPSRVLIAAQYQKFESNSKEKTLNGTSGDRFKRQTTGKVLINLKEFKVNPCTKKEAHDKKLCPYYHNEIDRRRSGLENSYCPELCPHIQSNHCFCDDSCKFCKNRVEQLYHPERYKKKFCAHYPNRIQKCEYGDFCSFAHNEGELRVEVLYKQKQDDSFNLNKLKTIFCPFKNEHDRSSCPYAHNVQDYRRNPEIYTYGPEECQYWKKADTISSYEQAGCPKMLDCEKCHGWKEYEFHYMVYKTRPCTNAGKCQKKDCSYYHSNKDKRDVKKNPTPLNSINPNQVAGTTHNNSKQSEKNLQSEKPGRGATIAIRAKENSLSPTNSGDHKVVPEEAPLTKSDSSFSSQELAADNRKADKGGDLLDKMISTPPGLKSSNSWSPEAISSEKVSGKPRLGYLKPFNLTSQFNQISIEEDAPKRPTISCYSFIQKLQRRGLQNTISIIISAQMDLKTLNDLLARNDPRLGSISEQEKEALKEILNETLQEEDEITSLMSEIDRFTYAQENDGQFEEDCEGALSDLYLINSNERNAWKPIDWTPYPQQGRALKLF